MKKTFLLAFVFVACTAAAQVQFGFKAGLNVAKVTNVALDVSSSSGNTITHTVGFKMGPHGGVYFVIPINDNFYFQPELMYSMKGYKYQYKQESVNYLNSIDLDVSLGYIEVPLNFKYKLADAFGITGGPYFGIISSVKSKSKSTLTVGGKTTNTEGDDNDKTGTSSFDLGANLGVSIETSPGFLFGARYALGLKTIDGNAESGDPKNLNSVIQVFAGFTIGGNGGGGKGHKGGGRRR